MDTIEMLEKRETELLELLGRTQIGTEDYQKATELLVKVVEMKNKEIQTENARLNNNEANDINRQKVEVEAKKVDVEIKKIRASLGGDIIDLVKCGLFGYICYHGEQVSYAIKDIKKIAESFLRRRR